jgi:cell division septation protein DedD
MTPRPQPDLDRLHEATSALRDHWQPGTQPDPGFAARIRAVARRRRALRTGGAAAVAAALLAWLALRPPAAEPAAPVEVHAPAAAPVAAAGAPAASPAAPPSAAPPSPADEASDWVDLLASAELTDLDGDAQDPTPHGIDDEYDALADLYLGFD